MEVISQGSQRGGLGMTSDKIAKALVDVWDKHCEEGDYVFLSRKNPDTGDWRDYAVEYNKVTEKQVFDWLRKNPPEKYNLYFCPLPFREPRRLSKNLKGSKLLWSDMDEIKVDNGYLPSIYWESSPDRYQGLWELDKFISPAEAELLNKELTYAIGADKGGWDLTQVLRVPGTTNHKYEEKPQVSPFILTEKKYKVKNLEAKLTKPSEDDTPFEDDRELEPNKVIAKHHKNIPREVLSLLKTKRVDIGKRSDMIWYMEHELHKAGLAPPEIISLIKNSAWNKYAGRADEDTRLKEELSKIISSGIKTSSEKESPETEEEVGLRIDTFTDVMVNLRSFPGWLVEGFWMRRSHGIVAGEPKSFKSILTLDLAISVASGKPCLGQFPVSEAGPVLIIQNENSDWIMKDRMEKILHSKGLTGNLEVKDRKLKGNFCSPLPMYFINQQGFLLGDPIHQEIVEKAIEEYKPILILFDPLYLMFDGDVNSAKDLNPVLNWMLKVKNEYNTGIIAVHHWNKGGGSARGGQRMLGSTTLHGWVESAWYIGVKGRTENGDEGASEESEVTQTADTPVSITIEREFRAGGTRPKIDTSIRLGELGDPTYQIDVKKHVGRGNPSYTEELPEEILNVLDLRSEVVSQRQISEETGKGRRAIKKALDDLVERGKINLTSKGVELIKEGEENEKPIEDKRGE